jgi:NAD(P)-dependent dehydrogenase (short-subunit alcohol dehydrogenase family)
MHCPAVSTILITGASRGIGYETARVLVRQGHSAAGTVGELDVLVNNAGVLELPTHIGDLSAELVTRVFDTNVFGAVWMMTAFLPLLVKSARAAFVNITSSIGSLARSAGPDDGSAGLVGSPRWER